MPQVSPILSRPYTERQLIVVAADEVVEADRKAKDSAKSSDGGTDWSAIAETTFHILTGSAVRAITEMAVEAIRAWSRARASGLSVLAVGRSEAAKLQLPPGHPRDGVLYVGHPALPSVYYTPAVFHRLCFEHKFCEAIDLLMNLGATRISVEHVSGWAKEFSANLSVPLGTTDVGLKGGAHSKVSSSLLYNANFDPPGKPKVPKNLVWYPHEPTWQQISVGRLKYGLTDFTLSVRYEHDFGINAGFRTAVTKAGFDLGGKFEEHQSTVWRIQGDFVKPSRKGRSGSV